VLSDWKTVKLDDDATVVTYTVKGPGFAAEGERNSSIWANRGGKWVGLFHHGGTLAREATAPSSPAASPAGKASASPTVK
jgi:hypothetical protein